MRKLGGTVISIWYSFPYSTDHDNGRDNSSSAHVYGVVERGCGGVRFAEGQRTEDSVVVAVREYGERRVELLGSHTERTVVPPIGSSGDIVREARGKGHGDEHRRKKEDDARSKKQPS